jgi:hypothetical protein
MLMRTLRAVIPQRLVSGLANCGGTNFRKDRFAGNLVRRDLTDEQFIAILHSLIFPNGVRKTTTHSRNTELIAGLLDRKELQLKDGLRALDIGASGGLDALSSFDLLASRTRVARYLIGDLYTKVLFDRDRGLIFDEDHNLIQVERALSFVAMFFSYNFPFQRLTNLPKRVRPWLLSSRKRFEADRDLVEIPLVHPSIDVLSADSPFRLQRMNVFEPIHDKFDLIICMHLLVPRYFSPAEIERGVLNLASSLEVGGTLIAGATEAFQLVSRSSSGELVRRSIREGPTTSGNA